MTKCQKIAWYFVFFANLMFFICVIAALIVEVVKTHSMATFLGLSPILLISPIVITLAYFAYRRHNRVVALIFTLLMIFSCIQSIFTIVITLLAFGSAVPVAALYTVMGVTAFIPILFGYVFIRALVDTFRHHKKASLAKPAH